MAGRDAGRTTPRKRPQRSPAERAPRAAHHPSSSTSNRTKPTRSPTSPKSCCSRRRTCRPATWSWATTSGVIARCWSKAPARSTHTDPAPAAPMTAGSSPPPASALPRRPSPNGRSVGASRFLPTPMSHCTTRSAPPQHSWGRRKLAGTTQLAVAAITAHDLFLDGHPANADDVYVELRRRTDGSRTAASRKDARHSGGLDR